MTNTQETVIKRIRNAIENMHGAYSDSYEIKEWTIDDREFFVNLYFEVGLKNDEGTMAALTARDCGQIFIGKRGGISYPVYKNGKSYTKRFTSLHGVIYDQR